MKLFDLRTLLSIAAALLLSACGGGDISDTAGQGMATAAPVAAANAPVADCEAEGCNRPRIVDGLAEQYRAAAVAHAVAEPAQELTPPAAAAASGAAPDAAAANELATKEAAPDAA